MNNRISNGDTIAQNRKARANLEIEEEFEAGIVLRGTEVKSLRQGRANIADAHAAHKKGEIWLINASIAPYAHASRFNHEERASRKLLLNAKQMKKLIGKLKIKGYTIVPLTIYFNKRGFAKVKLGLGKGYKEYEKRDVIKKRDWEREKGRLMRNKVVK